jgi:hypothetical protein
MTCVSNACSASVRTDLGLAVQSGPKNSAPRSGVWSSSNVAYLVYPMYGTEPLGFNIQALDASGATTAATTFSLPNTVTTIETIATAMNGDKLGILWHGLRSTDAIVATEFTVASLAGAASPPMVLGEVSANALYPYSSFTLFAQPLTSTTWSLVEHGGTSDYVWSGYIASTTNTPTNLPLTEWESRLPESPLSITVRSYWKPKPQAAAVVNGVLFVTGFDQAWYSSSPDLPSLIMSRYNASTLAPLAPTQMGLSLSSYPTTEGYERTPALGKLGNQVAAFWTEYSANGALLLGKALFDTDSSTAIIRTAAPSNLIPKAMVETPTGAGMLVASRIDTSQTPHTHTIVVQRFDSNLNWVGDAYPISLDSFTEPDQVLVRPSTDGRVLVTFRQDYAQHRILHADLCH